MALCKLLCHRVSDPVAVGYDIRNDGVGGSNPSCGTNDFQPKIENRETHEGVVKVTSGRGRGPVHGT
jgi:hypothetical protein